MSIEYNVYCDESRHTSDPTHPYMVIGAIRCPRDYKRDLVGRIHHMQARHKVHGEIGWKRVSPNRQAFYEELIQLFAADANLSFRCLVADRNRLNHAEFNEGDAELGFYKLYYQMLVHWLEPGNSYHVYLDWQQNKTQHRLHDLSAALKNKLRGRAKIACLEPVTSSNLPLLGLTDVLIGAVGYTWNDLQGSPIKLRLCSLLVQAGQLPSLKTATSLRASKVNIFKFEGSDRGG